MTILLVGAGRMGQRHLRGLRAAGCEIAVVDPRREALDQLDGVHRHTELEEALGARGYAGAVLAATAEGRLERFEQIGAAGVPRILVEKPLEQSRERVHALAAAAGRHGVDARVNHFFRTLPLFAELRGTGGPFELSVTGGAYGLACNGIHWLDLALYLSGDRRAEILFGELDEEPIGSGRGPQFRDYGGRAVVALGDGGRLYLSSAASSSAPMHAVVDGASVHLELLPHDERARLARRDGTSPLPSFRYGAGYDWADLPALEGDDLWRSTERWAGGESVHPTVETSVRAHDLLFDLLERDGRDRFPIT